MLRPEPRLKASLAAVWLVLSLGLGISALLTFLLARDARRQDKARFERLAHEATQLLETRIERYELGLASLAEFFFSHEIVTEAEWLARLDRFSASVNYSGLLELGYAHKLDGVWSREPPEWVMASAERRGLPPFSPLPPERADTPILFHYVAPGMAPIEYGQPLFSRYPEDRRNETALRAIKTSSATTSPRKVVMNASGHGVSAFTFYLPVYRDELTAMAPAMLSMDFTSRALHREIHFRGLLFATFHVDGVLDAIFGAQRRAVKFELYSSAVPTRNTWLNDGEDTMRFGDQGPRPYLDGLTHMRWYGQSWAIYFYTTEVFDAESLRYRPWLAAGLGIPLSFLLAGITWTQARGRARAEELANSLRVSEERLQIALREREQISRDLHDGTIQSLYAIGLGLGRLRRMIGSVERDRLDASLLELDHVVGELRGYLVALDPGVSPAQSPSSALAQLVERLRDASATELTLHTVLAEEENWPPAAVLDMLFAAREGVSNALRHGGATQVKLTLNRADTAALLTIEDNGKGFAPECLPSRSGHGLQNLERRARLWNGWLKVESQPGGPTKLTLAICPSADLPGHGAGLN